jgi:diaminopimelate decarboxylase
MDHFTYRDGDLYAEEVPVAQIAASVGTPTYVYSAATLRLHVRRLREAFAPIDPLICFAVKCCPNVHVLRTLAAEGCGMDVVSGGELARALAAGVAREKIVFAGVGKTDAEIGAALACAGGGGVEGAPMEVERGPIGLFNVESEPEFEVLARAAREMRVHARCALRVNPGVKAGGHDYVTTATPDSKFGVGIDHARELLAKFGREKHLQLCGLHVHIGSSILSAEPYAEAVRRVLALADEAQRLGARIEVLDIGGGFGADYHTGDAPSAQEFARVIVPLLEARVRAGLRVIIEPGRTIAANAGVLVTRVLYVKHAHAKKFIVTDAGMQTLLRPSLYGAFHFIWPVRVGPHHEPVRRDEKLDLPGLEVADVVGPVCESGDFLAKARALPLVARGDLLAVYSAGAYGMSMASRYNSHPLPAEVLVDGQTWREVRRRESVTDLLAHELRVG